MDAIDLIVSEGEGSGSLDPYQTAHGKTLAHFYQFEEIVCGKKLVNHNNVTYSYTGNKIHLTKMVYILLNPKRLSML